MSPMSPTERKLRARAAAFACHAQGRTSTKAATAASLARFDHEVDPEGTLSPEERARRAGFARKAYFAKLGYLSAKTRAEEARAAWAHALTRPVHGRADGVSGGRLGSPTVRAPKLVPGWRVC